MKTGAAKGRNFSASPSRIPENRVRGLRAAQPALRRGRRPLKPRTALRKSRACTTKARQGHGLTQYLYGNLSNPFQVTASRAPDNVLTVYYYDDFGALYALERSGVRYYVASDHLGTPKVVTDNTGTVVRQMEYDSWGVKTGDTNPKFPSNFVGIVS